MKRTAAGLGLLLALTLAGLAQSSDFSEFADASKSSAHMMELFGIGGRPTNGDAANPLKILVNHAYAVGDSESRRCPVWAMYHADKFQGATPPVSFVRTGFFFPDSRVSPVVDGRTFGGGMDRGHMVPNAAIASQYGSLAQLETFYMSNMCPQASDLNQRAWMQLEGYVSKVAQIKNMVYVISGPIFGPNPAVIKNGPERGVQVPDAFYMILVDSDREFQDKPKLDTIAFRFPQGTPADASFKDRAKFGTSIDAIEVETGFNFFPEFDENFGTSWANEEKKAAGTVWATTP